MTAYTDFMNARSLVFWWRGQESTVTAGSAAVDTAGGHNGVYVGTCTANQTALTVDAGDKSVLFDGTTGEIDVTGASWMDQGSVANSFTAGIRFAFSGVTAAEAYNRTMPMFARWPSSGSGNQRRWSLNFSGGNLRAMLREGGSGSAVTRTAELPWPLASFDGVYSAVMSYDSTASEIRLYFNGILVATTAILVTPNGISTPMMTIGNDTDSFGDLTWQGRLDEAFLGPLMTHAQIKEMFTLQSNINDPTPGTPADNPFDSTPWIETESQNDDAKKWMPFEYLGVGVQLEELPIVDLTSPHRSEIIPIVKDGENMRANLRDLLAVNEETLKGLDARWSIPGTSVITSAELSVFYLEPGSYAIEFDAIEDSSFDTASGTPWFDFVGGTVPTLAFIKKMYGTSDLSAGNTLYGAGNVSLQTIMVGKAQRVNNTSFGAIGHFNTDAPPHEILAVYEGVVVVTATTAMFLRGQSGTGGGNNTGVRAGSILAVRKVA